MTFASQSSHPRPLCPDKRRQVHAGLLLPSQGAPAAASCTRFPAGRTKEKTQDAVCVLAGLEKRLWHGGDRSPSAEWQLFLFCASLAPAEPLLGHPGVSYGDRDIALPPTWPSRRMRRARSPLTAGAEEVRVGVGLGLGVSPPACSTTIPTAWLDPLPKGELHALVSTAGEDGPASSHGASGFSASGFVRSLPQSSSLHTLMERPNLLGQGVCQMWFPCFGTVLPSSREDNIYHSPSTNCSKRYAVSAPRENHARRLDSGEA